MIENKDEKEESEEDEEEEEESDDESEEKKEKKSSKKETEKKSEIISKKDKISVNNNKNEEKKEKEISSNNKITKDKNLSINKTSQSKTNKNSKNINEKYTEKDIIENAGFKIEKSSKKSENELEKNINNINKKKEIPFEEKLIPDPKEVRDLRVHAAKIRNDFPKWNKIQENKGGELAVKCWNCENINICNSNMNVIQCPVCNEMNKVPKIMDRIDELLMLAKANTCVSYADINHTVPLVNYIVVCPYCKCDNKVRETACFCICYMCKNRWTIKRPGDDENQEEKKRKPPKQRNMEGNYYKYDAKTGRILPPDRPMRFSDLFYPDPMFYPGYYPINSLSPLYPEYFTPYDDYRYIDRQEKTIKYFDRVNQQRKLIEKFGNILDDDKTNNNKNDNISNNNNINLERSTKYEKPYYHLNYENNIEKKDILRQLEDLDRKSENLMKSRLFPNNEIKNTQNSIRTIKSRYGEGETSSLYEKTKTSQKISSVKSDMKYNNNNINKSNNNISNMSKSKNNVLSKSKKSKENESNSKSKSKSKGKSKRSSMGELPSKYKSIENTYFMKENK